MKRSELASLLRNIADAVESGDSAEGAPQPAVDPARAELAGTGIYLRARGPDGSWGSYDIAALNYASLIAWLRSRGGLNPLAESLVAILLGHPAEPR